MTFKIPAADGTSRISDRSRSRLEGVHPDLVRVVELAARKTPFIVTEGRRSLARQKELLAKGASRTLKSRHLTGHAVDLADVKATYSMPEMRRIALAMKAAANDLDIPIEWGGDWKSFVDTPHFQLPWKQYPSSSGVPLATQAKQAAKAVLNSRAAGGAAVGGGGAAAVSNDPSLLPSVPVPELPADTSAWLPNVDISAAADQVTQTHVLTEAAIAIGTLVYSHLWLVIPAGCCFGIWAIVRRRSASSESEA